MPECNAKVYKLVNFQLIFSIQTGYTAFTPNDDGLKDVIKPILVGVKKLNYFTFHNRWGQLVFNSSTADKGWDGKVNGNRQDPSGYVFMAEGIDYLGKTIFKKGTFVLIR